MMLYPAMSELLKQVPSRYQLVNVVAARARKIAARAEREGLMLEEKPVSIAVQEIADGKLDEPVEEVMQSRRTPPATSSPITPPPWKPRPQSLPLRKQRRSWRALPLPRSLLLPLRTRRSPQNNRLRPCAWISS